MLTREQVGQKLTALTADGAAVMGTGRNGGPVHEPKPGQNLASALQDLKTEFGGEKLVVVWCASHRMDLIAKRIESQEYVGSLMRTLRRMATHIQTSSLAQGYLRALHKALDADVASAAETVSFAPQRFVSHAAPSSALVKSFPELLQYLAYLLKNGDDHQRSWATAVDAKDLKMWLVLAGIADMLAVLHKANLSTQRQSLRILEVDKIVATVKSALDEYMEEGRGTLAMGLRLLMRQTVPDRSAKSHIEFVGSCIHVARERPGHYRAAFEVGGQDVTLRMHPQTLNETVSVLTDVLELVLEDVAKRFAGHEVLLRHRSSLCWSASP